MKKHTMVNNIIMPVGTLYTIGDIEEVITSIRILRNHDLKLTKYSMINGTQVIHTLEFTENQFTLYYDKKLNKDIIEFQDVTKKVMFSLIMGIKFNKELYKKYTKVFI